MLPEYAGINFNIDSNITEVSEFNYGSTDSENESFTSNSKYTFPTINSTNYCFTIINFPRIIYFF